MIKFLIKLWYRLRGWKFVLSVDYAKDQYVSVLVAHKNGKMVMLEENFRNEKEFLNKKELLND